MVKVDLGHGYQSTFLFECKNWEESIGKNEIIVFSEKIKAIAATKGYFIAKSFGQYTTAQAALDDRMELITATPDFPFFFPGFHYIFPTLKHIDVVLGLKSIKPLTVQIDLANARARFNGKDIDLVEEIKSLSNEAMQEKLNTIGTQDLAAGIYEYEHEKIYSYKAKRLILNGRSVKQIRVKVYFSTEVIWPRIICRFDIANRGRVIEYEKIVSSTGQELGIAVIATHTDTPQTPESTN